MAKAKTKTNETPAGVPALVVTPDKAPVVSGNFEQVEAYLRAWRTRVSEMEITESNMEQARLIKKEAVAYRNSLMKIQADIKRTYFNGPKDVFDAQMGKLFGVVNDVESATDEVLAKEERERVAGIDEVIDRYVEKFQAQYGLDDERLERIERKKSYYNKTAGEKERKDDIEQQFRELKKEQDAHAANVRLINTTCRDEPRLNVRHWLDRLRHDDVATVTEAIIAEKQRLKDIDAQAREPQTAATGTSGASGSGDTGTGCGAVKIGIPAHIGFESDFKGRVRHMNIEITYPCDLGDALTQLFAELKRHGIKVRQLKEEALF